MDSDLLNLCQNLKDKQRRVTNLSEQTKSVLAQIYKELKTYSKDFQPYVKQPENQELIHSNGKTLLETRDYQILEKLWTNDQEKFLILLESAEQTGWQNLIDILSLFLATKIRNLNQQEVTQCLKIEKQQYYDIEKLMIKQKVSEIGKQLERT